MRIALLFPPTWTLNTGSPHLAIPLLAARLRQDGYDVLVRDLNWELADRIGIHVSAEAAILACESASLSAMNEPYFAAEDRLIEEARPFGGTWNAQFGYRDSADSHRSSRRALVAATQQSPYSDFYSDAVVPSIMAYQPDVIAFSVSAAEQLVPTLELCRRIKESESRAFVVLGGNTITRLITSLRKPELFDLFDGLIVEQGEESLCSLCRCIALPQTLSDVPQLTWRDEGLIVSNTAKAQIAIDQLPTPDFSGLPVGRYWGENHLNLVAERGCYYGKCSFCAIPFGWGKGGYAGRRGTHRVVDDIRELIDRHGIRRFKFVDEAMSPHTLRELSEMLIESRVECEWEAYVRLEDAWHDEQFVERLANSGFQKGYFGLEILDSPNRYALRKNDTLSPKTLIERCTSFGIKLHFFCMFGFPGTTVEDAFSTTNFILANSSSIDTVDVFPWVYARHTTVPNVQTDVHGDDDWALEYENRPQQAGVMSHEAVVELAAECEDLVWNHCPRMLHPTYRLVSPWADLHSLTASKLSLKLKDELQVGAAHL